MSLDVHLKRKIHVSYDNRQTWEEKTETVFRENITHNLNKMADKASIYQVIWRPEEVYLSKASQLIDFLQIGLDTLKASPDYFRKFNPENGWGSYERLVEFVEKYLEACKQYPDADIEVDR